MAYVQLLSELPADRRRELARQQVAALAMRRASSERARRALEAALRDAADPHPGGRADGGAPMGRGRDGRADGEAERGVRPRRRRRS
jgi:hypothetical protein